MSRRRRRTERPKAQVDMTSLIDLTFLLLVTFIVTLPALENDISIMLPKAKVASKPFEAKKVNIVTIDEKNQVYLNNRPKTHDELRDELRAMAEADPEVPVKVRADERLDYGNVMKVVKIVYNCSIRHMALVTLDE